MEAVPKTYAALLNGPPISIAIMAASMNPRRTLLVLPIPARKLLSPVLIPPITGSTINVIPSPITRIPTTGYISTGAIFSNASGNLSHIFLKRTIIYPAAKPATRAPKNPDFPLAAI